MSGSCSGGRGLSAKILTKECDPNLRCARARQRPGPSAGCAFGGTTAPTSGRISIGGKSPLTNGIKEANAGGNPGQHLMKLGIRAVIVHGQADGRQTSATGFASTKEKISDRFSADDYKGMWNYALV